ncbi:uncharacterized protein LOC133900772 isoform X2 [Phragmites australis]|uniref:uncharacterized protein LOC133900772 isoform X2 n=1 Tax=Phragmites australis TaxID=29695 RepID=UPI002D796AA1|nr:uncharacterized protein LOC133900772 isoform X2 [Phragmites australis]
MAALYYHSAAGKANLEALAPSSPSLGLRPSQSKVHLISSSRWWMRRRRWEGKASRSISSRARAGARPALFSPVAMDWQECTLNKCRLALDKAGFCRAQRVDAPFPNCIFVTEKAFFHHEAEALCCGEKFLQFGYGLKQQMLMCICNRQGFINTTILSLIRILDAQRLSFYLALYVPAEYCIMHDS